MSTEKEQRVVQMQFDNKQFEAGVSATLKSIDELNKTLELTNSTKAFSGLQNGISKLDLSPIASGVESIANKFTLLGMTGVKILDDISDKAISVGKNLWNQTIGQIQSGGRQRALNMAGAKFKLQGMGIEWEQIGDTISDSVTDTAYSLDAAASAAAQFAASGVELGDDMKEALSGITGVAAMTGASYEEISNIFTAAAGKGRVQAMELQRIALRGLNPYATLAKQLGTTEEEVRELVSKGAIDFKTFAHAMNEAFGAQAKKSNETYTGSLANLRAALSRIGEIFYTPILDSWIKPFNTLKSAINNVTAAMKPAKKGEEALSTRFDTFAHLVSDVGVALIERFAPGVDAIREKLEPVNRALDKANGFLTDFKSYLGLTSKEEQEAVEGASALGDELDRITDADKKIALDIWNFSDPYGNGQQRIDMLGDSYDRVQKYINTFIETGYDVAKTDEILGLSAEEAAINTESLNDALSKGKSAFKSSMFEKLAKIFSNISAAASNISYTVVGTVKALFSAFGDVFSIGQASDDLVSFSEVILKVTEYFKPTEKTLENIKKSFRGVIAVFDILYQAIRAVVRGIGGLLGPLLGKTEGFGGSLLSVTGTIGDFIFNIDEAIKKGDIFGKMFNKLVDIVKNFPIYFKNAASAIKDLVSNGLDKLSEMTGIDFKGIFKSIADGVKMAVRAFLEWSGLDIHEIIESIKNWGKTLWEAIKTGDYKKALNILWRGVKNVFGGIAYAIGSLGEKIKTAILQTPIGPSINKFLNVLTKLKNKIFEILGQIFGKGDKKHASGKRSMAAAGNSKVVEAVENETTALEYVKKAFITVWEGIKKIIGGIVGFFTGANSTSVWSILRTTVQSITSVFKEAGFESIRDLVAHLELSWLLRALLNFSIASKKIASGVGRLFKSLAGYARAKSIGIYVGFFKTIAKSMLMIAGSIVLLAVAFEMFPNGMTYGFALFETLLVEIGLICGLTATLTKQYGEIKIGQAAAMVSSMGYAMIEIALAFSIAAKAANKYGWEASLYAIGMIGTALTGMVALMTKFSSFVGSNEFSGKAIKKVGSAMKSIGVALILASLAFSIAAKVASKDAGAAAQAWAILVTLFAGMYGFLYAVSVIASNTSVTGAKVASAVMAVAAAVISLSLAMDLMVPAILALGAVKPGVAWQGFGVLAIMVAELATIIGLLSHKKLGFKPKKMMAAAGAISLVAMSLSGLVPAIVILGKMPLDKVGIGMLEVFGGLMAIVLAVIGVANAAAPSSLMAAAGSIAIISASLIMLAPAVAAMGALPLTILAKGLGFIAGGLLAIGLISKKVMPAKVLALAGAVLMLGLSVLSIAEAFWIGTKAVIAASAAWSLIEGMGTKVGHEIGQALAAIADEIIQNAGKISLAAGILVAAVVGALIETVLAFIPALAQAILVLITSILYIIDENAMELAELVGSIAVKLGIGFVKGIVNGILTALGATADEIKEAWHAWWTYVTTGEDVLQEDLNKQLYDSLSSSTHYLDNLYEQQDKVFERSTNEKLAKQEELRKKYGEHWESMATTAELAEATIYEKEQEYLDRKKKQQEDSCDDIEGIVEGHYDSIEKSADEHNDAMYKKGETMSKNYTDGAVNGFIAGKPKLFETISNSASTIVDTFKKRLAISSPSKVMEKNGAYTIEGLIDGIDGMMPELKDTTNEFSDTVSDGFTDNLQDTFSDFSISDTFSDALDDEEVTVTPVIDSSSIKDGASDIEDELEGTKVGGLDTSGFDLSSLINSNGNLSMDLANTDDFLNKLNLDGYFGGMTDSNLLLANAIGGLSDNIYDMNTSDKYIETFVNLDGYNIAQSSSIYNNSIFGDSNAQAARGLADSSSQLERDARINHKPGYTSSTLNSNVKRASSSIKHGVTNYFGQMNWKLRR